MTLSFPLARRLMPGLAAFLAAFLIMSVPVSANATGSNHPFIDHENRVITLTHSPCQIIEAENNVNHNFDVWHESHCRRINRQTGAQRLEKATVLSLPEGKWTFIIHNNNVPWKVGFWLRAEQMANRLSLPKAELSGYLSSGETGQVTVFLKTGNYIYSCPNNPTLAYRLAVIPQ